MQISTTLKVLAIQLLVAILTLEGMSWLASTQSALIFNSPPPGYTNGYDQPLRTEQDPWGAWRPANTISTHSHECFSVAVVTNEIGARDNTFLSAPQNSVLLLGDSFAEGYGVPQNMVAASLIETQIDRLVHNMGSSGNFGPLQQYLLYATYKDLLQHNELLIFVLPANDFTDNDRARWANSPAQRGRYRPYFGSINTVEPYYFPEATRSKQLKEIASPDTIWGHTKRLLIKYTWSANTLRTIQFLVNPSEPIAPTPQSDSFYITASKSQQTDLLASYTAIASLAVDRKISFVIIPSALDIEYYVGNKHPRTYYNEVWFMGLQEIASKSGGVLLDLLDHVPNRWSTLFHECDGHWSIEGNLWAANIISSSIFGTDVNANH